MHGVFTHRPSHLASARTHPPERHIAFDARIPNQRLRRIAAHRYHGIVAALGPVHSVRRKRDPHPIALPLTPDGLTLPFHKRIDTAVFPVESLVTPLRVRIVLVVQHGDPLAIAASDLDQIIGRRALHIYLAQIRFVPMHSIVRGRIAQQSDIAQRFSTANLDPPIDIGSGQIPHLKDAIGRIAQYRTVERGEFLPGILSAEYRVGGMALRLMNPAI